jgi:hypothetical protein
MSDVTFLTVYHRTFSEDEVAAAIAKDFGDPDVVSVRRLGFTHFHVQIDELNLDDLYKHLVRAQAFNDGLIIRINYGVTYNATSCKLIEDTLINQLISDE